MKLNKLLGIQDEETGHEYILSDCSSIRVVTNSFERPKPKDVYTVDEVKEMLQEIKQIVVDKSGGSFGSNIVTGIANRYGIKM